MKGVGGERETLLVLYIIFLLSISLLLFLRDELPGTEMVAPAQALSNLLLVPCTDRWDGPCLDRDWLAGESLLSGVPWRLMFSPSNSISKKFLLHFDYVYRISLVSRKIQSSFSPSPLCAMCVTSLLCICCSSISYLYSFRGASRGLLGQFPACVPSVPPDKVPPC